MPIHAAEIVTLGYASVDHFICVDRFPASGQKIPYSTYSIAGGGQAATGAVALSRWGVRTRYVGRVGDDATGNQSIEWLNEEGVLTDAVLKTRGITSQTAYIIVPADSGERTVVWRREPGLNLSSNDLRREWFRDARVLFIDGHELDAALTAARWVKEAGGKVVLDAEHIGPKWTRLLELTDIAVGSEDFGLREFGTSNPEETIEIMRHAGVGFAGVTLGKRGSIVDWGEGLRRFRSIDVDVVDTTGAGDVFHAAIAYAVLKGMNPVEMFSFATVCAGLSCRFLGGRAGIPGLREVYSRMDLESNFEISID